MKLPELDELIVKLLTDSDHPEIDTIEVVPTRDRPDNHTRVNVKFADGSVAYIMVTRVVGPGIPKHADYEIPREALR